MRPEQIHTMPKGVALMVHPGQQPALIDLIPYTKRHYGQQLANDRDAVTALLRDGDPDGVVAHTAATTR
jgi:hypothetical protein